MQVGGRKVNITGGEPLIHPRWNTICRDLAGLGLRLSLITNGTLLDDENLTRALNSGVVAFGISLDGMQATHDSIRVRPGHGPSPWRETVAAIERASGRAETIVITAVNRRNLSELPALCDRLMPMGVRRWQVQLVVPMGRVLEYPEPLGRPLPVPARANRLKSAELAFRNGSTASKGEMVIGPGARWTAGSRAVA